MLCRTHDGYWLVGEENPELHRVSEFYAWDETSIARATYVELVHALRQCHGDDYPTPRYVPLHRQPNCEKAAEVLSRLRKFDIEIDTGRVAAARHSCAAALKRKSNSDS